jgi:hypothetical protein
MTRSTVFLVLLLSLLLVGYGGRGSTQSHPNATPLTKEERKNATVIEYEDSDAFDGLLEAAITRPDQVILVQTKNSSPDWQGRLNAWIAAWNEGGKVKKGDNLFYKTVRILQRKKEPNTSEVSVKVPDNTATEIRSFVEGQMDRIERLGRETVDWWKDNRKKTHRVELLKPYQFIFEKGSDGYYQIIFYKPD